MRPWLPAALVAAAAAYWLGPHLTNALAWAYAHLAPLPPFFRLAGCSALAVVSLLAVFAVCSLVGMGLYAPATAAEGVHAQRGVGTSVRYLAEAPGLFLGTSLLAGCLHVLGMAFLLGFAAAMCLCALFLFQMDAGESARAAWEFWTAGAAWQHTFVQKAAVVGFGFWAVVCMGLATAMTFPAWCAAKTGQYMFLRKRLEGRDFSELTRYEETQRAMEEEKRRKKEEQQGTQRSSEDAEPSETRQGDEPPMAVLEPFRVPGMQPAEQMGADLLTGLAEAGLWVVAGAAAAISVREIAACALSYGTQAWCHAAAAIVGCFAVGSLGLIGTRLTACRIGGVQSNFCGARQFALTKMISMVSCAVVVALGGLMFPLCIAKAGLLCRIPFLGDTILLVFLSTVGFPLLLLGSFIALLIGIGGVLGMQLCWPALMAEGTDAFDAISRSFSYLYNSPYRTLLCHAVCAVVALLTGICVVLVYSGTSAFGSWGAFRSSAAVCLDSLFALNSPGLPHDAAGWVWLGAASLALAAVVGAFFTVHTWGYFWLRLRVDGTKLREVCSGASARGIGKDDADLAKLLKRAGFPPFECRNIDLGPPYGATTPSLFHHDPDSGVMVAVYTDGISDYTGKTPEMKEHMAALGIDVIELPSKDLTNREAIRGHLKRIATGIKRDDLWASIDRLDFGKDLGSTE